MNKITETKPYGRTCRVDEYEVNNLLLYLNKNQLKLNNDSNNNKELDKICNGSDINLTETLENYLNDNLNNQNITANQTTYLEKTRKKGEKCAIEFKFPHLLNN